MALRKILLSPLVHFMVLGALIFGVFYLVNDEGSESPQSSDIITLSNEQADLLVTQFSRTWNRPPTPAELDGLMQSWALQEAFVREALQLGLDRGDEVIRQRLSLKMQFIAESGAAAMNAEDAELQRYLEEHSERFYTPARISFEQIMVPDTAGEAVEDILTRLSSGEDPTSLGRPSLLPASLPLTPVIVVDRTFGTGFGDALSKIPVGDWAGPIESGFGLHLVRVTERIAAQLPPLADIRQRVETEWRAARAEELQKSFNEALLERYAVNLPNADAVLNR